MPYKKIVKQLPFDAKQLYNLIIKVEDYPKFIPHCSGIIVNSKNDKEIIAIMGIEYYTPIKKFNTSYTSRIDLDPYNYLISISNFDSQIFKNLSSSWKISPTVDGSQIEYDVSFTLQNPILNFALSSLLMKYSEVMVDAFTKRAYQTLEHV